MNLKDITDKRQRAVWKRAFRIWQHTPHQVAPNDENLHTCQSCGTVFRGNYCPRCGQSFQVGRFSFKVAIQRFLDAWGLGNRGFFITMRDLMLRPGYMIRDYVSGCQSAYFPPFQQFFILATFSLLLEQGIMMKPAESASVQKEEAQKEIVANVEGLDTAKFERISQIPSLIDDFEKANPSIFSFLLLMLLAAPMYLFFRHCPAIPDLRFSEHIAALVYTSNMYSLYRLLGDIIPLNFVSNIIKIIAVVMLFIALKQFTGIPKLRLFLYLLLTILLFFIILFIITVIVIFIIYYL